MDIKPMAKLILYLIAAALIIWEPAFSVWIALVLALNWIYKKLKHKPMNALFKRI